MSKSVHQTQLLVLGSGPGGYAAAFRAADLGMTVALVERYSALGGVCANVGCIPSKAALHAAEIINEIEEAKEFGVSCGKVTVDVTKLSSWKDSIIGRLTQGLAGMAKQRKVHCFEGVGRFVGPNTLEVNGNTIEFEKAIVAAGSEPIELPFIPHDDPRVLDSTSALQLKKTDGKLLVLGGGIIGCEMATVYRALGAEVDIVEMMPQMMPGTDLDLVSACQKIMTKRGIKIEVNAKVTAVKAEKETLKVSVHSNGKDEERSYDQILVSVGRRPNGLDLGLDSAGVEVSERGFIPVNDMMTTNVPHIMAIGDVVGQPMLAHKATAEGRCAAEIAFGKRIRFDARCIPSVAYTDPEVAWVGLTETEAKEKGIPYQKGVFPWAASGRSMCIGRSEGLTKLLYDPSSDRILGGGIVGKSAGDLIAEIGLAIEMGCYLEDVALTIHPHPTLAETIGLAAEVAEGTVTDLPNAKKKK